MEILGTVGVLLLLWTAVRVAERLWWRPRRLERALRAQGLDGTQYRFVLGDLKDNARMYKEAKAVSMPLSHDILPRVFAFLYHSANLYGKNYFTWSGPVPRVIISDPEMVREVLSTKMSHFEKSTNPISKLLVTGLVDYEGEKWVKHRRIINPAFHLEKLKEMFPVFSIVCCELINKWECMVSPKGSCELDVWPELQKFAGEVISRTAFGSSYEEGRRIFQLQTEQAERLLQAVQTLSIPGYRFLPTANNLRMKEIAREVHAILKGIIEKREKAIKEGIANPGDLLGLLMESNMKEQPGKSMTTDEVIEECKLFYFAGQETTSALLTWTMVALSMHSSWQVRAREEVLKVFGKNKPDKDGLGRLKIVTMILYEVLRLYSPGPLLGRRTSEKIELGGLTLPRGVLLFLSIIFIHHDPEFWGEDVNEFKPERFAEGVSKASKSKAAFFPFSFGPRICIGQSFAMMEAKMALSMILQHFSFELSPSYVHAPYTVITLQPQHGAHLIMHKL